MHNDNPYDVTRTDIRRTAGGAIDTDYYHRRARDLRAGFLRAVISCIARCGWRAWDCIKARMEDQTARHTLSTLSSRELKDIGLARGDIEAIASGAYFTDPTRDARSRERLKKCA